MKETIAVVIQTYNEETQIVECINTAKLLTENILLIDTESTDKTVERAKNEKIKILSFPNNKYVEPARTFGIQNAEAEWIFLLDADERITLDLAHEIKNVVVNSTQAAYKIPRKNIFGNKKWLQSGGWYPDNQLRLIRKEAFIDWPARIHSTPNLKGEIGFLKSPFLHYFHPNLTQMVSKTINYENIESDLLYKANRPVTVKTFFRKFFGELYRRLIKKQGYRDGVYGIIESIYQAYSKTITYLYLYEKYLKKNHSL